MNQKQCSYYNCRRKPLESSRDGSCIFHAKAEDKNIEEFREALKSYIEEIKEKDLDYNFSGFIFPEGILFREDFKVSSVKNANFREAEFEKLTDFTEVEFEGGADFSGAKFKGDAKFFMAEIKKDAHFPNVKFGGEADFIAVTFKRFANFTEVEFEGGADFNKTEFLARTYILPKFIKKRVNFRMANLENISLTPLNLDKDAQIDFMDARLRNTKIRREDVEGHIMQESEKKFSEAKEVYLLLKNNFHTIGRCDDEGWAFKKEKDMKRKSYFHNRSFLKWLGSIFLNILYGYGEQPGKVITSAITIIFIFTFLFMSFGIVEPSKEPLIRCNIAKEIWLGIRELDLFTRLKSISWGNFGDCLYFSTITFTTLGYGDFRPLQGVSRLIAGIEAFIGAFMMALFVYTFARRTGGR